MTVLDTHLIAAVVYPNRARLTRQGTISLKSGKHQLEIKDLTLRMDRESARSTASGTVRSRLLGLQIKRVYYAETPEEKVGELEAKLEAMQDELAGLQAMIDLVVQERSRLEELAGHTDLFATALVSGESDVDAQFEVYDRIRKRSEQLNGEHLELQAGKRKLERKIKQLQNQLKVLRNKRSKDRFSAFVDVEMLEDGEITVELSYVVSAVGWTPLYDLRLIDNGSGNNLEISYLAQVTQKTGEDWVNLDLTLSTARPTLSAIKPELQPWYIYPLQDIPAQPRSAALKMAPETPDRIMEAAEPQAMFLKAEPSIASEEVQATVSDVGTSVTYQIPDKVTVPADGSPHKVSVTRISLSPDLDYVAAPRLIEAAYRRINVSNNSPYTFLPGPVSLFAGDEFIGRTEMEMVASEGELELFFGTEDRIMIERELKRKDVDKRLIGGKRMQQFGYEIRLENLLSSDVAITVQDQIPVSGHEDIKVRLENANPKPSEQTELNILEWKLNLEPGEKQIIRFDYGIEYPQKLRLPNLRQLDNG
jgi:uncharacterized protein (TIGR02231 family)